MKFSDEYEFETNSKTYYVTVSGCKAFYEGKEIVDLQSLQIFDENNELVEDDHEDYSDIYEDALSRDYENEVHSRDFDSSIDEDFNINDYHEVG